MRARWLVVVALLISPVFATAQPLADRLPNDTLVYLGWRGADSLGPGFEGSHLKGVLDASNLSQVINEFLPDVLKRDRKSTRLNSSHRCISYAVFCLKKKTT